MAEIASRFFPYTGETNKALLLRNEEYIRPLPWGSDWNKMRIGLWFLLPPPFYVQNSLPQFHNPYFTVAITSGPRFGCAAGANCLNAFGVTLPGPQLAASTSAFQWTNSSGYTYYNASYQNHFWRTGTTMRSTQEYGIGSLYLPTSSTVAHRALMLVDLSKTSSGSWFSGMSFTGNQQGFFDSGKTHFLDSMEQPFGVNTSTSYSIDMRTNTYAADNTNFVTFATPGVTESYGPLNSLNIWWHQSLAALEIYGIVVKKYA